MKCETIDSSVARLSLGRQLKTRVRLAPFRSLCFSLGARRSRMNVNAITNASWLRRTGLSCARVRPTLRVPVLKLCVGARCQHQIWPNIVTSHPEDVGRVTRDKGVLEDVDTTLVVTARH